MYRKLLKLVRDCKLSPRPITTIWQRIKCWMVKMVWGRQLNINRSNRNNRLCTISMGMVVIYPKQTRPKNLRMNHQLKCLSWSMAVLYWHPLLTRIINWSLLVCRFVVSIVCCVELDGLWNQFFFSFQSTGSFTSSACHWAHSDGHNWTK